MSIFEKKNRAAREDEDFDLRFPQDDTSDLSGTDTDPLGQRRTWLIGRQHPCDIILQDESVSRKHAQIVETSMGYYLSDLRSANGTFVNGYRLIGETRIYEQDELQFGTVRIRFSDQFLR